MGSGTRPPGHRQDGEWKGQSNEDDGPPYGPVIPQSVDSADAPNVESRRNDAEDYRDGRERPGRQNGHVSVAVLCTDSK